MLEEVYGPYDNIEDNGCDWTLVKPSWIEDHGTVIVLLGNSPTDNTVEGDPNRQEAQIKGISAYINRRFWEIPDDAEVYVDELRDGQPANWPRSEAAAHNTGPKTAKDCRTNFRRIRGAQFYITYPNERFTLGRLGSLGTVPLSDGTEVDWYLWDGNRPAISAYASEGGVCRGPLRF